MHVEPSRITFRMWGCGWQGAKLNDCTDFALRTPFLRFARRHSAGNDASAASTHSCNGADSMASSGVGISTSGTVSSTLSASSGGVP
jgi:hypothetical protein